MEKQSQRVEAKLHVQVALIVPTLRRPDFLYRCLRSLESQRTSHSIEVLVGIRWDDDVSRPVIKEFSDALRIRQVEAKGVGVVGAMNSCLAQAQAEFVGFVDDDVELPPDWVEIMIRHLENHPRVLGAGARDLLQDHPEMRRREPRILDVGRLHWFGRISGNQYRGAGKPRKVDVLRGSNCLYQGAFLRGAGLDGTLRGKGAQVHWEVALALQARRQGKRLFYDPEIEVLHHVAPRLDSDQIHRGRFSYDATVDLAFNETIVTEVCLRPVLANRPAMAIGGWLTAMSRCGDSNSERPKGYTRKFTKDSSDSQREVFGLDRIMEVPFEEGLQIARNGDINSPP